MFDVLAIKAYDQVTLILKPALSTRDIRVLYLLGVCIYTLIVCGVNTHAQLYYILFLYIENMSLLTRL
jgi:hypothetical protein